MALQRTPKTLDGKLRDLEAHLYLLRQHCSQLTADISHLKVISAELRTLVCTSSGTEGLLWRLAAELGVNDRIYLHVLGDLIPGHPLARGLQFAFVPIQRGGQGDPRLPPYHHSLKAIIKDREAVVVAGKPVVHEHLIKAISQQMGTAHEDDGIEPVLSELMAVLINGVAPFVPILAVDAELTLEIGERILEHAELTSGFQRPDHHDGYGNLSAVIRLRSRQRLACRIPLLSFHSYVSAVEIVCAAGPSGVVFTLKKHDSTLGDLLAPYPADWESGHDAVFVFSYCSRKGQARTLTNGTAQEPVGQLGLGWLHACDLKVEFDARNHHDLVERHFALTYERLLAPRDVQGLYDLPPSGYGLWRFSDDIECRGVFPE